MDGDKLRRGDRISLSISVFSGTVGAMFAYESAYRGDRLYLAINVLISAINFTTALSTYGRLKRRRG